MSSVAVQGSLHMKFKVYRLYDLKSLAEYDHVRVRDAVLDAHANQVRTASYQHAMYLDVIHVIRYESFTGRIFDYLQSSECVIQRMYHSADD